ncbi:uncharacterized protein LOC111290196 [Durio zibethinus]|uniref:Uncharacterized protein LOC111290196 n=1 Tax=Durio zibethinus TaxID=66656 RepID=A0A6P5YB81_DURZI|nr:uncharacterized protein LOC111290196 [Durio zibethinus]
MLGGWHFSRVDTLELKSYIERKIGRLRTEKYFNLFTGFLSLKIGKPEFDRLCIGTIGRENVRLHNYLLTSIIRNASLSKTPPSRDNKLEGSLSVKVANGTPNLRDHKFRDHLSPLGPHGKSHGTACEDAFPKVQEQKSTTELLSFSRLPGFVEDGEKVDQAVGSPSIHNELPDSSSLRKRLEQKLEIEGLNISVDCINLLNNSLDVFMKRLIKPCLEPAGSKNGQNLIDLCHNWSMASNGMRPVRYTQKQSGSISASMLDFRVALEQNPLIFGVDWPTQLKKLCLLASED